MNNTLCIIIIIILLCYIGYKQQLTIEGMGDVQKVLDGTKDSCPEETNPTYTYTSHIKPPKKLNMSTKSKSVNKNLSGLSAYTDLLTKGKGKASKKKKVLGGRYYQPVGVDCYAYDKNAKTCEKVTSTCYKNDVPSDSSEQGLIPGLISDLNILSGVLDTSDGYTPCTSTAGKGEVPACTKVALSYATDDCMGYGVNYVLNSDINRLDKGSFYKKKTSAYSDGKGNAWPSLTENYTDENCNQESFTMMNNEIEFDPTLQYKQYYTDLTKKDPIKQAFILILGLSGIYLLQSVMLK